MSENYYTEKPDEVISTNYFVKRHDGGWRRIFPTEYQSRLRPIAEVLAMIEYNDATMWKSELPEADAIYRRQDHLFTSWTVFDEIAEVDPTVKDVVTQLKSILKLKGYGDV